MVEWLLLSSSLNLLAIEKGFLLVISGKTFGINFSFLTLTLIDLASGRFEISPLLIVLYLLNSIFFEFGCELSSTNFSPAKSLLQQFGGTGGRTVAILYCHSGQSGGSLSAIDISFGAYVGSGR